MNHKKVTSEVVLLKGVMSTWVGSVRIIRHGKEEHYPVSANGTGEARATAHSILKREGLNPGSVPIYWYHGGIAYRTHGNRILPELRELLVDVAHSRFLARGRPLTPLEATTLATKQTRIRELEKLNYEKFYT